LQKDSSPELQRNGTLFRFSTVCLNFRIAKERTERVSGYDFRLTTGGADYLAIEVKGMRGRTGSLLLTPREYELAANPKEHFYLFVVKNFRESPFHEIYQDPLSRGLRFTRKELIAVQVCWFTNV
jgi:hypothetical protein